MKGAMHKVNHIDINPSGNRFMFLHRWKGPKGRFMRLITSNRDGTELFVLNGDIMTSHCCWLNDKEILSYCEYQKKRGYFKFYDQSDEVNYFSNKMPKIDGHPSISPLGNWVITDTYRNKKTRMTYLYLYNISENRIIKLARFFHPFKYKGEIRVDLHPKWSPDGKSIFVESGHTGRRQLYKIDITKIIAN
jgi:Tol biopolymer transport system component